MANPTIGGSLSMRLGVYPQGSAQFVSFLRNPGRSGSALAGDESKSFKLDLSHGHLGGNDFQTCFELWQVVQPSGLGIDEPQCLHLFDEPNP